jgi:signal transduction histidine kinase
MAEAQAREARIEAALEKVRSRSLAMHRSEELKEVIQVVYDQLLQLNIHVDHAGFIIDYREKEDMHIWLADQRQGVPTEITIPYFDSPHWNSYRKAKAKQESFFANLLPFEVKNKFYQDLFKWIPELTGEAQQAIFSKPALAISTVLLDNVGLYIEHYSETPYTAEENKILMRIGKVFQQTYTRFLDLQKAEAQAREAQIEAAVERVRAQSMAMHRTDDLHKVTEELLYQLNNLSVDGLTGTTIYLVDENDIVTAWDLSSPGNIGTPGNFTFSYDAKKYPVIGGWVETWRTSNQNYFSLEFPKEALLNAVQEWKKIHPEIAIIFENAVVSGKLTHQWSPAGRLSKGILAVDLTKPPTNDTKNIVTKMAGAFNLAFQRFEDLQNAEAQAREAEIELALERVRARTMAMQHSYELTEASEVLDLQVRTLGIETWGCAFHIYADDPEGDYEWFSSREGTLPFYKTPRENFFLKFYEKGKAGETFHVEEFLGEDCKAHYDYLMTIPVMGDALREIVSSGSSLPESQYDHIAFFKHGFLLFITYESVPESHAIFQRFAKVFEQTYTRFLDLQKAEEQAREAQINLAVERIRAMALAMHQTSELKEVIKVVDDQIKALNVDNSGGAFIVINEDLQNGFSCWGAGGVGNYIRKVDIPFLDRPIYKELKKGIESRTPFFTENYGFDEKWEFFKHLFKHAPFDETPPERQKALLSNSLGYARSCVVSNNTSIFIINHNGKAFKEEENKILREIGRVFEQAYTRFLDLQKAETQAREAKIETALEKVRSRTMGMQNSEELPEVANLLFTEVRALGIHAWSCGYNILAEDKKSATCCMSSEGTLQSPFQLRLWGEASFDEMGQFLLSDQKMLVQELGGKALEEHYAYMKSFPDLKPTFDEIDRLGLSLPTFQINHLCKFNQGFILFITYEKVPGAHDIFKRFTKVFDQTYTRFLDLQKAEAQAREARIEAALERVRSRTMGMQKAGELGEVATVLFGEMNTLVNNLWTCGFVLCEKYRKEDEWWLSLTNGLIEPFFLPNIGDHAHELLYEGWEKGEAYRKVTLENEQLQEHYNWLMSIPIARKIFEDMEGSGIPRPNWQRLHAAYFKTGYLVIITEVPFEEEEIFKRFAQVFDLTYTRFLDLQKAEKQAREAQIQAALEKVRSRSLAMQSPNELVEVAQLLREEMGTLGVEELETSSIYIQDEASGLTQCWFTIKNPDNSEKGITDQMAIDLQDTWVGRRMDEFYRSTANQTSILMHGEERIEWIRYCEEKTDLFGTSNFYGETIPDRTYHLYKFSNGYIGAAAPGEISTESWDLLRRATAVFSFAYTRFQDIQRAEASARAALRQASLDRVRADISTMRSAGDLDRITPLIFQELTVLGVPFIRCGVFIIQEKQKIVEAYLSSPEGNSLGVLRLPYQASELTYQTVEAWRREEIYRQHWNKEDFVQWINQLMEQDQIQDSSTYQGTAVPPESLDLHFVPFAQGMLYVGAVNPMDEEELELVQALAKAFSIAYARFEDFVKLEQAKAEVESAMSELKATQSQLVQQEKLASLGQLTAGIAHEIKNPLNFVNNFSEVSIELVDEAIEERSKSQEARDETLVDEILEDIKSNLKKVHEHGSRANGIVTSMLQHSRGGSGKKEPTDLNALIKEYVNLSFHGMRAGKNPINVDIILDLDPEIKEVSLIKEDFSRVIINLCNNAFDAMKSVKTLHAASLRVSTKKQGDKITIEVSDNGPGIPDDIKDKIMQPFFTTKKGTEGTGLGLSITHDIVKAHGGELRVESQEGLGTVFRIQLPKN